MSKYKMDKVIITTRKGKGSQTRTLSPKEIKPDNQIQHIPL